MSTDLPYPSPYPHLVETEITTQRFNALGVEGLSRAMATNASNTLQDVNEMIKERQQQFEQLFTTRPDLSQFAQILAFKSAIETCREQSIEFQQRLSQLARNLSEPDSLNPDSNDVAIPQEKPKRKRRSKVEMLELRAKGLISSKRQRKQKGDSLEELLRTSSSETPFTVNANEVFPVSSVATVAEDSFENLPTDDILRNDSSDVASSITNTDHASQSSVDQKTVQPLSFKGLTVEPPLNDNADVIPVSHYSSNSPSESGSARSEVASATNKLIDNAVTGTDGKAPKIAQATLVFSGNNSDVSSSHDSSSTEHEEPLDAALEGKNLSQSQKGVTQLIGYSNDSSSQLKESHQARYELQAPIANKNDYMVADSQPPASAVKEILANVNDSVLPLLPRKSLQSGNDSTAFVPETQETMPEAHINGLRLKPLQDPDEMSSHDKPNEYALPRGSLSSFRASQQAIGVDDKEALSPTLLPPDLSVETRAVPTNASLEPSGNEETYHSPSQPAIDELLEHLASPEQSFALTQLAVPGTQQDAKAAKRATRQERKLSAKHKVLDVPSASSQDVPQLSETRQKLQAEPKDRIERAKQRAKAAKHALKSSQTFASSPTPADQDAQPLVARPLPNGPVLTQPSPTPVGRVTRSRSPSKK